MADKFDYGEALRYAIEEEHQRKKQEIFDAVHAGLTEWFKTATPEQLHELIFEPYESFKKENNNG